MVGRQIQKLRQETSWLRPGQAGKSSGGFSGWPSSNKESLSTPLKQVHFEED
jgi:hypothetical protein